MEEALYSADGFFGSGGVRSAQDGDFLTSPEVSREFGRAVGHYARAVHDRIGDPFTVVEVGAGSGSLLRPLLEVSSSEALAVERSPAAVDVLKEFVPVADQLPDEIRGVVVANEVLDNIPMALAQLVGGEWRERWVGRDRDDLVFVDREPRPEVVDWLDRYAGPVPENGWVEVQLAARDWLREVCDRVSTGAVLMFDYGDTAENLASRRPEGTLRTYQSHHLGPDPLYAPGDTDLTADVNFSALVDVAPHTRLMTQAEFLGDLGMDSDLEGLRDQELQQRRDGNHRDSLVTRSKIVEIETLLHPRGLGDFRVVEISL